MSSGSYAYSAGMTTRSNASSYAPTPDPGGRGILRLNPSPLPSPFSDMRPELEGKFLS